MIRRFFKWIKSLFCKSKKAERVYELVWKDNLLIERWEAWLNLVLNHESFKHLRKYLKQLKNGNKA